MTAQLLSTRHIYLLLSMSYEYFTTIPQQYGGTPHYSTSLAALCRRATRWSQQVTKLSFSTKVCSQHPFMNLKTMFRNSVFLLLNSQIIISFLLNVILANSSAILKQTRYLREGSFWLIDQSERKPDFESCFQISQLSKKYHLSSRRTYTEVFVC